MLLNIHDNLLLEDIQERFSASFPLLKLEFYCRPHRRKNGSVPKDQIDAKMKVGDIRKKHDPGILEIKSTDTTGSVESMFKDHFGLNVQLFRKGKDCWIQSITTNNYTLHQQSELASAENIASAVKLEEQSNYDDFL